MDFFPPFLLEFMFFMIFFKSFGIASLIVVEVPFCMHYQENIDELIIMWSELVVEQLDQRQVLDGVVRDTYT